MADIVTFDPTNKPPLIIEIGVGGDNVLNVAEIYSEWKAWLIADPSRLAYPAAFRYVGSDPITESQNLGTTFFLLNGWKIRPAESSHKLELVGNLFTDPAGQDEFVDTIGAFVVRTKMHVSNLVDSVLVNAPELQFSTFNNRVTVDAVNGVAGTAFPAGTGLQPVNNSADALLILQARGLSHLHVIGDMTVDAGLDYSGLLITGESPAKTVIVVSGSANVEGCEFRDATVSGTFDGDVVMRDCVTGTCSMVKGLVRDCQLRGTFTLAGTSAGQFSLVNCVDDLAGSGVPTINCGGDGPEVIVRGYNGGLALTNKSGIADASVDGVVRLILLPTYGGTGSLIVRGVGPPVDNQASFPDGQINNDLVSVEAIWGDTATYGASTKGKRLVDVDTRLPIDPADESNQLAQHTATQAAIVELNDLSQADVQSAMTAQGYTAARAIKIDFLDAAISTRGAATVLDTVLKHVKNRLKVDIDLQQIVLYDNDGTTVIQRWPLLTKGGEPVTTATGVQVERGAPLL